jgi:hypothetical protein
MVDLLRYEKRLMHLDARTIHRNEYFVKIIFKYQYDTGNHFLKDTGAGYEYSYVVPGISVVLRVRRIDEMKVNKTSAGCMALVGDALVASKGARRTKRKMRLA